MLTSSLIQASMKQLISGRLSEPSTDEDYAQRRPSASQDKAEW